MRGKIAATCAVLLVVVVAWLGVRWWQGRDVTDLERALELAPTDTARYSWTDWAGVRRTLDADLPDLPDQPTAAETEAFLDAAYDADLSPMSSLVDTAPELSSLLGLSPATVDHELLAQSEQGVLLVLRVAPDFSFERLEEQLRAAGYTAPGESSGVWDGMAVLGPHEIPAELSYLALDPEEGVVRASDSPAYLESVLEEETGPSEEIARVADVSGEPLAAALYSGSWTCAELSMGQADESDQEQADALIRAAGDVDPTSAFAMARRSPEEVAEGEAGLQVALAFADQEQAVDNADSRSRLASGPAVGQGGDFADRFELGEVAASDGVVTLQLRPADGADVLSDLSTGPLLFATC